jgi:hypothetical protein
MFSFLHIAFLKVFIIGMVLKTILTAYVLMCKRTWLENFIQKNSIKILPKTINIICDQSGEIVPWMTSPAIEYLKQNLRADFSVFEFGCGSSTIFFSKRCKIVHGVETRSEWLSMLNSIKLKNVKIRLLSDGLTNPDYEKSATKNDQKFDVIVIDSIKRSSCATNAINALKNGGMIILDDSERDNYRKIFDFFREQNFRQIDFPGMAPGQMRSKNTSIFFLE